MYIAVYSCQSLWPLSQYPRWNKLFGYFCIYWGLLLSRSPFIYSNTMDTPSLLSLFFYTFYLFFNRRIQYSFKHTHNLFLIPSFTIISKSFWHSNLQEAVLHEESSSPTCKSQILCWLFGHISYVPTGSISRT